MAKKYASLSTLQTFLDNLKTIFATKAEVENIDLSAYETTTNAESKLTEAKTYADTAATTALQNATADDFGIYVQDTEPTDAVDGDIWVDTVNDPAFIVPNLPEVTEADNGKVLMVVNGTWQAVELNLSVDANGVVSV